MEGAPPADGVVTFVTVLNKKDWIETPCSSDSDCPEKNAMCYYDKCLCDIGFIYSVGRKACVSTCALSDLQTSYIKYPEGGLAGYNMYQVQANAEECKSICTNDTQCMNFEITSVPVTKLTYCNFHYVPLSTTTVDIDKDWDFYAKTCA
ncbi:hypothetical protein V1264_001965 [Littorina saxatilis]|uniref:Apple domain-containing protein n=1 Tax=Littorina saxatilis TaxID=31220 RepID=A0AAN9C2W5_9CAEN